MTRREIDQGRPRTPGALYGVLSLVVLGLLGAVALTANQPSPPSIAEFSPQAIDRIEEAPDEQSSDVGSADGGCAAGQECVLDAEGNLVPTSVPGDGTAVTTTTKPPRSVVDVQRVRACVGNPPRQIEDPQSPPCVPFWEGDNGGATYKGVTANEIRIAVPAECCDADEAFARFLNSRFELYGRKIVIVDTQDDHAADPTEDPTDDGAAATRERQAAQAADEVHQVFASIGIDFQPYHDELARRKIINTTSQPVYTEAELAKLHPYVWQYHMPLDELFATTGSWACSRLQGRNAAHAGTSTSLGSTTDLSTLPRAFGVVSSADSSNNVDHAPLAQELRRCGASVAGDERIADHTDAVAATSVISRFKEQRITTILCVCAPLALNNLLTAAQNQSYQPEWVVTSFGQHDGNGSTKTLTPNTNPDYKGRMMGLSMEPRQWPSTEVPSSWASTEGGNGAIESSLDILTANWHYRQLLLLASGIQMAGPNLTPQTFAKALRSTAFPNPAHPLMAGEVGFTDGDHGMTEDAVEMWWSSTAQSPYSDDGPGSWCYVAGGRRHRFDRFPKDGDPFFSGECDSGA